MPLVIIFLVILMLLFFFLKHKSRSENVRLPPGPKGLPLIGNLHQLDNSNLPFYLWQLSNQHGPLVFLRLGLKPTLVVSSAKMAKETLKTHDLEFSSRPALRSLQILSYNGQDIGFSPYNAYWREMRKICVIHLFSNTRVQTFRPIREYEVSLMVRKISKLANASKPCNLNEALMFLTSTIICRTAFGKRYEDEAAERTRFESLLNETEELLAGSFLSDYLPCMSWFDRLTGMLPRLEKTFVELDYFYDELIKEHLDPKRPEPEREDILDILLQLWKDSSSKSNLTMDHIKGVLMNVFVAGTSTSAATVVWAMVFLMKNPTIMKKTQKEIRNLIGRKGLVNEDDVQRLPYLKAVVKETMRFRAVNPLLIPKETTQKCYINGYVIPAKTLVFVNAWAIGRDPEAWENPEEFYPERFIDNPIDFKGQDFRLVPFGAGRRTCPGLHMGIATVELSLANLLYNFDWEMPTGMKEEDIDTEALNGITVHKKNALCLMATNFIYDV
ncbi:cytochrome P450 83B1-like [Tripterygium wilfordii]|uniref:cytochrome P450 83B1-like n=1 Tax=Tripterygium wilfordii TaxID=458696 RepID=UPI0018F85386|nr:cytochrome P450 83B1-like [Tripterygium wilfordii]